MRSSRFSSGTLNFRNEPTVFNASVLSPEKRERPLSNVHELRPPASKTFDNVGQVAAPVDFNQEQIILSDEIDRPIQDFKFGAFYVNLDQSRARQNVILGQKRL